MEYQSLTAADQEAMLRHRLRKYEADHYEQAVTRELLMTTGDVSDPGVAAAITEASVTMAQLEAAHAEVLRQIAGVTPSTRLAVVKEATDRLD